MSYIKLASIKRLRNDLPYDKTLVLSTATQRFFQVDAKQAYEYGLDDFVLDNNDDRMPGFNKATKDVKKSRNFWQGIITSAYESSGYFMQDLSEQFGASAQSAEQIFLPEGTKSSKVLEIVEIFNTSTSDKVRFVPLVGKHRPLGGQKVTGQNAEVIAKEIIEVFNTQKVVFVCVKLGQRSFSVSAIEVVHLMYDGGSLSGSNQKGSRSKTAAHGQFDKVAKIVSWSLGSERDLKIDMIFTDEATRLAKNKNISISDARKEVFDSMPLYRADKTGMLQVSYSRYMEELDSHSSMDTVCKRIFNADALLESDILKFKDIIISNSTNTTKPDSDLKIGKTFKKRKDNIKSKTRSEKNQTKDLVELIKDISNEGVKTLKECRYLTNSNSKLQLEELMSVIEDDKENRNWFYLVADFDFDLFKIMVDNKCWGFNNNYLRNVIEL